MLRFKQFAGSVPELEQAVNRWLEQFEPDVSQMVQTQGDGGTLVLSFLFEESFRGQELRLSAEHHQRQVEPAVSLESIPDEPVHVSEDVGPIKAPSESGSQS